MALQASHRLVGHRNAEKPTGRAYREPREGLAFSEVFESASIYSGEVATLDEGGTPRRLAGGQVSAEHFEVLGVGALLGRTFQPADHEPGADVVLLSHSFWQRGLGGDPGVLGHELRIDGRPRTVEGVLPAEHRSIGAVTPGSAWWASFPTCGIASVDPE